MENSFFSLLVWLGWWCQKWAQTGWKLWINEYSKYQLASLKKKSQEKWNTEGKIFKSWVSALNVNTEQKLWHHLNEWIVYVQDKLHTYKQSASFHEFNIHFWNCSVIWENPWHEVGFGATWNDWFFDFTQPIFRYISLKSSINIILDTSQPMLWYIRWRCELKTSCSKPPLNQKKKSSPSVDALVAVFSLTLTALSWHTDWLHHSSGRGAAL